MAQLEEQLNQILGNPQAMEQIMALAQSLSGKQEEERQPEEETQPPAENDPPSPLSALDGLDPRLLRMGMGLLSEYSAQDDKRPPCWPPSSPFSSPSGRKRWIRPSASPGSPG